MSGLKVLAAMSGGVDSATAAARAVDAGHEVTGVHLALSANPSSYRTGARGCCTLEDARDARRAADVIGIPFYVWDMAERFHRDVVQDFVAEYAAGRTPNPCLRCNEKIKFAAVLDRGLALRFDPGCTGHYARIRGGRLHPAADSGKDQSHGLAVLTSWQIREGLASPTPTRPRPVWTGRHPPGEPTECLARLRPHGKVPACTAWLDGDEVRIRLHYPARGVAKGQAAVLYDADTVLGSATISA